jgi:hypothetical protein
MRQFGSGATLIEVANKEIGGLASLCEIQAESPITLPQFDFQEISPNPRIASESAFVSFFSSKSNPFLEPRQTSNRPLPRPHPFIIRMPADRHVLATTVVFLHLGVSLCVAGFAIYWITRTASALWFATAGASLFVANCFLALFSLLAFLTVLALRLNLFASRAWIIRQIRVIAILLSLTMCWVDLSLSTYRMADRYYGEFVDYAQGHSAEDAIVAWMAQYWTYHARAGYVLSRSSDLNGPMMGLLATWTGVAIVDFVLNLREFLVREGEAL